MDLLAKLIGYGLAILVVVFVATCLVVATLGLIHLATGWPN